MNFRLTLSLFSIWVSLSLTFQYLRVYSRRNCQSECMTKIFYENCHCIIYNMPRVYANITICGRSDDKCIDTLRNEIKVGSNSSLKCDCPYGCHNIKFEMELSSMPIFEGAPRLQKNNLSRGNASILQVYYQSTYYRSEDKEELIGFTEFLCMFISSIFFPWKLNWLFNLQFSQYLLFLIHHSANCGGLLGLFMGFSIFSIFEIIYFISIRPYFNCMRDSKGHQVAQKSFNRFNNMKLDMKQQQLKSNDANASSMNNIVFLHWFLN